MVDQRTELGIWLGLIVGNSRLHWARFQGDRLISTWDTEHLQRPTPKPETVPLLFASVVPAQTRLIRALASTHEITLADIPMGQLYPTLGIDRALALLGAGQRYGWPVLVIDGGTALTLTGADGQGNLVGGAILPGIQLQLESLAKGTAALPYLGSCSAQTSPAQTSPLPQRWARTTEGAIASGVLHGLTDTLQAYIQDWKQQFPDSPILLTGGAAGQLAAILPPLPVEACLAAWGIRTVWRSQQAASVRSDPPPPPSAWMPWDSSPQHP